MILEHSKTTASEGWGTIVGITATVLGMGVFQFFLFPTVWASDRLFVLAFVAIELVVCTVAIIYAVLNIRAGGTFVCTLNEKEIRCVCPVKACGDSFTISLSEIEKIEKEVWSDSHRWYIWDKSGHRFWLTTNYDNPADRIVELIKEINPTVTQIAT